MPGPDDRKPVTSLPAGPLSRRELFPTVLGAGVGLAAAFSLVKGETAQAQSKASQKTAKYQDSPNKGESCAQCNFFRAPNACLLVEGTISPNGWCSFWAKKPA